MLDIIASILYLAVPNFSSQKVFDETYMQEGWIYRLKQHKEFRGLKVHLL